MKKSPVLFLVFICLLFLIGCNKDVASVKHEYHFYGEEKHWKATLDISGNVDTATHYEEKQKDFVLEYKGDYSDISDAIVSYAYTTSGETEGGTLSPSGTKYIRDSSEAGDGNMRKKDELIEVVVKWNDKDEKIPLKIKND